MFANQIGISQVVVLPDQGIEEFLFRRSSNLSQFDRCKLCQGTNYRGWLKIECCLSFSSSLGIVIVVNNPGRKSYQLIPFELE